MKFHAEKFERDKKGNCSIAYSVARSSAYHFKAQRVSSRSCSASTLQQFFNTPCTFTISISLLLCAQDWYTLRNWFWVYWWYRNSFFKVEYHSWKFWKLNLHCKSQNRAYSSQQNFKILNCFVYLFINFRFTTLLFSCRWTCWASSSSLDRCMQFILLSRADY